MPTSTKNKQEGCGLMTNFPTPSGCACGRPLRSRPRRQPDKFAVHETATCRHGLPSTARPAAATSGSLLVQLLEPDGPSIACGSQSVNDSVVMTLDLSGDDARASKISQPFLEEPEMVRDQVESTVDERFDPGQGDGRLPFDWGASRELDDGIDCLGFPSRQAEPARSKFDDGFGLDPALTAP